MTRRKSSSNTESDDNGMEVIDCFLDAVGTHSPSPTPEQSPNNNSDQDPGDNNSDTYENPDERSKYTTIQQFCHMQEQIDDLHMQVVVDREILIRRFNAEMSEVESRLEDSWRGKDADAAKTKSLNDQSEVEEMRSRITQLEETVQGLVTLLGGSADESDHSVNSSRVQSPPCPNTAEQREAKAQNTSSQGSQTDLSAFSDSGFSSPAPPKKQKKVRSKKKHSKTGSNLTDAEREQGKKHESETASTSETDDGDLRDSTVEGDLRDQDRSASKLTMPKPSSIGCDRIILTSNPFADISKFESRNPVPTFVDWYRTNFHPAAVEAGLSDIEACKKLRSCLGHTARQAYDLAFRKVDKYSLKHIVANLEVRFSPEEPLDLDELYKRRMQPSTETAEVYAIELETLFDKVCPSVSEDEKQKKLARIFRKGVPQDLLDGCHMFPYPKRLDETVRRVKHYEKRWRRQTGRIMYSGVKVTGNVPHQSSDADYRSDQGYGHSDLDHGHAHAGAVRMPQNAYSQGFPGGRSKPYEEVTSYHFPDHPRYPSGSHIKYGSLYNTGYDIPPPSSVICQICKLPGHDGYNCSFRFTDHFPPSQSSFSQTNPFLDPRFAGCPFIPPFGCPTLPFVDFSRPPPPNGFVPGFC